MFDNSYESLMNEYLGYAPEDIDTREGSVYYDAGAGFIMLLAKFYTGLNFLYEQKGFSTAIDENLEVLGADFANITRNEAVAAQYELVYTGTKPNIGARFMTDGHYFSVVSEKGTLLLEAEVQGISENSIAPGTKAVPVKTIDGLTAAEFGVLVEAGVNLEDIEAYRQRLRNNKSNNCSNRAQIKSWCEDISGVGRARVLARVFEQEEYKNKGIILSVDGSAADKTIIENVQEFIDPDKSGKGNGVACIGLPFIAEAPAPLIVNLSIDLDSLAVGYSSDDARNSIIEITKEFFKEFNFGIDDKNVLLSSSKLAAKIIALDSISDYNSVVLSTDTESGKITVTPYQYISLGEVSLNVSG